MMAGRPGYDKLLWTETSMKDVDIGFKLLWFHEMNFVNCKDLLPCAFNTLAAQGCT